MDTESLYIKHIENGIRTILNGSKTPKEAKVGVSLMKLKEVNEGLYMDYLEKYKKAVASLK
jgi:hypothetical protein